MVADYSIWESNHTPITAYTMTRILVTDSYPAKDLDHDLNERDKSMVGFHIRGHCPGCFHPTSAVCATRYLAEKMSPDEQGRDRHMYTTLKCACIGAHTLAPPATFGCGAEWMLKVSYNSAHPGDRPLIAGVPQAEAQYRWAAADANGAAIPGSLSTFQTSAGKWQTALTAIVALVGIGSLLTGRSTFQTLIPVWQLLLVVALGVAVLSDGLMLWAADLASLGFPSLRSSTEDLKDLEEADLAPLEMARKAEHRLWTSFAFAVPTIAASIFALAILLFVGSANPAPTYKVSYTQKGSIAMTTSCGTFSSPLPTPSKRLSPNITFTPKVNGATPIPVGTMTITSIAGC